MLDLKRVVDDKEQVLERLRRRGGDAEKALLEADPWALDHERRVSLQRVEQLRHRQRVVGEDIAKRGRAGGILVVRRAASRFDEAPAPMPDWKSVPSRSIAQATLSCRSAMERSERAKPWPRSRIAKYFALRTRSRCTAILAQ